MIKNNFIIKLEAERLIKEKINLQEDEYYFNQGNLVFTEQYHLRRGRCCKNLCLHCPYKDLSEGDEYRERNFDNYDD
jgi:hypothetical protein